ncbi:MAG: YbhB/YbcL family Raf kinase inhibitor-like protein, partial [Bacteroidales bacterium]
PPETGRIHEYIITIYALNVPKLDLTKETNPAMVGFYINAHTIQKASIVMYYQRNKK